MTVQTFEELTSWDADSAAQPFTAGRVEALARHAGLHFPETVLGAATAALRAGKHIVLTGPPGTGKSTLAKLLADCANQALMNSGHLTATATSDWTIADTVGTSHETSEGCVFRSGVVVDAVETGRWLIIDELNRANIDRAFGELFSVLSGQAVVLPHRRNEFAPPLSIVPHDCEVPAETEPICIPKPWRMIATMNTYDRGLLFSLSRALMRRFAFVNVASPDHTVFRQLLEGAGSVVAELLPLRELQDIGPAVFLDAAEYAAIRALDGTDRSVLLLEAFTAYFIAQLDDLDEAATARLLAILDGVLAPRERHAARGLLGEFGLPVAV